MRPFTKSRCLGSVVDTIGNTPLVRLNRVAKEAPGVAVWLKLEYANPGGSVKDRPARRMVLDAMAAGRLDERRTLTDATSGNTGVAYSLLGAALGFRVCLVMPSNVTRARREIAQAFGAEVVFSDPMEGTDGAIAQVRARVASNPDLYFYPDQYANPSNPMAHYEGTAAEILAAVGGEITHFVAGLGTSGTFVGSARRLHEHSHRVCCVAVQPAEALHGLEGLKHMESSLVPPIFDPGVADETIFVTTEDGWNMADRVAAEEGLHVGHSTGANVHAAVAVARRLYQQGKPGCVVTVACDRGDRYFAQPSWEKHYVW